MSLYGSLLSPEPFFHPRTPVSVNPFSFNRFRTLFTLPSTRISRNPSGINRLRTLAKKNRGVGWGCFVLDIPTLRRLPRQSPASAGNHRFLSPFLSSAYKSLFAQPLCFFIYTNPRGWHAAPEQFSRRRVPPPLRIFHFAMSDGCHSPLPTIQLLFITLRTLFTLRAARISRNSSAINRLRTLCRKYGKGHASRIRSATRCSVLGKIDEIFVWEKAKEHEKDARFVELGEYLCEVRAKQYWRLERLNSFAQGQGAPERRIQGSMMNRQVHYMTARSQVGGDIKDNLVTLCANCHRRRLGRWNAGYLVLCMSAGRGIPVAHATRQSTTRINLTTARYRGC